MLTLAELLWGLEIIIAKYRALCSGYGGHLIRSLMWAGKWMLSIKKKKKTQPKPKDDYNTSVLNCAIQIEEKQNRMEGFGFLPLFSLSSNVVFSERPSLTIPSLPYCAALTPTWYVSSRPGHSLYTYSHGVQHTSTSWGRGRYLAHCCSPHTWNSTWHTDTHHERMRITEQARNEWTDGSPVDRPTAWIVTDPIAC